MGMVLKLLLVLLTLGCGTTLTGRAACALIGVRWLRRRSAENFFLAALAGTGLWMLAFGWGSHLGLRAFPATLTTVGVAGLLVGLALLRGRGGWLLPPRPRWRSALLGAACVLGTALPLLPAYAGYCCNPFNDTFTYIGLGRWLKGHGFGEPCAVDPAHPLSIQVQSFQAYHLRMGVTFLLALTGELFPRLDLVQVFPAVSAWGLLLNLGGIFLMARWALRLPRLYAAGAAAFAALTFNPLYFSLHWGFQPQMFGTAALPALVALLSRCLSPCRWRPAEATLVGLLASSLATAYSDMLPFLALACLYCLASCLRRAWAGHKLGRLAGFLAVVLAAAAALGNIEWYRAPQAVWTLLGTVVPNYLPWSTGDFWMAALGMAAWAPAVVVKRHIVVGTALATLCLVAGLWHLGRTRRAGVMAFSVLVFGALAGYFHFIARDPVMGSVGNYWSLWKVCKYGFPLVVTLIAAGLWRLLRRIPLHGLVPCAALAACAYYHLPLHTEHARVGAESMRGIFGTDQPFAAWRRACRRLDQLGAAKVYLVHEPLLVFPRCLAAYLVYPRPTLNGWANSWLQDAAAKDLVPEIGPDVLPLMWGRPPFEEPREALPGGLSVLDPAGPVVFKLENPTWGVSRVPDGRRVSWLGARPAKLHVWSPRPMAARLSWGTIAAPKVPSGRCRLRLRQPDGTVSELVTQPGYSTVSVPVRLPGGVSCLELSVLEPSEAAVGATPGAGCIVLTTVEELRLTVAPQPQAAAEGREREEVWGRW
jgi:hypothetical protein